MKATERIRLGGRGMGALCRYPGSVNWVFVYSHNGAEHAESTRTDDFKKAKRVAKAKLDELAADRQGLKPYIAPVQRMTTVGDLLDQYVADARVRGVKALDSMKGHMKPLRAALGSLRAVDVTAETVDRYIAKRLALGKATATANRELAGLSGALRLAVRRRVLVTAPSVRKLPETNVRRVFYDKGEFEAVLAAAPDYLQDALRFFYLTGWRKSEVTGLMWSMVDKPGGTVTLPTSKSGASRTLVLSGDLAELFKRREQASLIETKDGDVTVAAHVFCRPNGAPLGDFKRAWATVRVKAGLAAVVKGPDGKVVMKSDGTPRYAFTRAAHDFRRTCARNLSRAGVRRDVAKAITGHKTDIMFSRYNVNDETDLRDAMEKVSAYVSLPS